MASGPTPKEELCAASRDESWSSSLYVKLPSHEQMAGASERAATCSWITFWTSLLMGGGGRGRLSGCGVVDIPFPHSTVMVSSCRLDSSLATGRGKTVAAPILRGRVDDCLDLVVPVTCRVLRCASELQTCYDLPRLMLLKWSRPQHMTTPVRTLKPIKKTST